MEHHNQILLQIIRNFLKLRRQYNMQFYKFFLSLATYNNYQMMSDQGENKELRDLYFTEKIKNFAYNAKYRALSYFEEYDKMSILKPGDQIYILGRKFKAQEGNMQKINQQIYQIFVNTPWLTYRSGFPQLKNQLQGSYVSDTGWGCMVRVGQMLFAQVIKHHAKINDKEGIVKILELFSDFDKSQPFSIQNIARVARIQYGLKPGQWYNPSQIAYIISHLHDKSLANQMKLKFCVFNSGNLFFDTLVETMLAGKPKCTCQVKNITQFVCTKCNKAKFGVATVVLSRLGLNSPEIKYLNILDKFIEFPHYQGVIGGKPQKALYFVGRHHKQYIYLDPHYVQNAEKQLKQQKDTYFCASFRKCKNTAIDSSMGICFYMRDIHELNTFYLQINALKNENLEDFFIFVADETPSYMKSSSKTQLDYSKDEDIFESL